MNRVNRAGQNETEAKKKKCDLEKNVALDLPGDNLAKDAPRLSGDVSGSSARHCPRAKRQRQSPPRAFRFFENFL